MKQMMQQQQRCVNVFDTVPMQGTVVIGEGEMDEAPMLYIGEKLGTGVVHEVDVAVDPVEGTNIVASGGWNALSCSCYC